MRYWRPWLHRTERQSRSRWECEALMMLRWSRLMLSLRISHVLISWESICLSWIWDRYQAPSMTNKFDFFFAFVRLETRSWRHKRLITLHHCLCIYVFEPDWQLITQDEALSAAILPAVILLRIVMHAFSSLEVYADSIIDAICNILRCDLK